MELSQEMIESAIMAATTGQFGTQIVYESFKLSIDSLSDAKKQVFLHICSGIVALTAYILTQNSFAAKAALLTFISGVFAEAVLKLLKKKNDASKEKTDILAVKMHELELRDKDAQIAELELELKALRQSQKAE
jgi:hypothetical protein